jgi:Ca-activated chloride channel homolog
MINRAPLRAFLLLVFSYTGGAGAAAQVMSVPSSSYGGKGLPGTLSPISSALMTNDLWAISNNRSPLESPNGALSKLDLKAPWKARRAYEKGYQLLMRKDGQSAVPHLTTAISIYPNYVSAHNALGTVYLELGKNDQARSEFSQAIALDDHLPNSYLNLGCAELALQHFPAAEESIQKASALAPLDLTLLTALAYGHLRNDHYAAAIATAHQVHGRNHDGAALVHFYAAAALEAQGDLLQAQLELKTLLQEDPQAPAAKTALRMIQELEDEAKHPPLQAAALRVSITTAYSEGPPRPAQLPDNVRKFLQASKENQQIAEAEAQPEAACPNCGSAETSSTAQPEAGLTARLPQSSDTKDNGFTFRASTDEVALLFSATDHGKPVTNLTGKDVGIRDDRKPPAAITGFRSESELPLRLGMVIDTSSSISGRFKFEQSSATSFLQKVVTGRDDLAFVIGVANSVLLAQDFTPDQSLLSHAVGELVPSGGTALWDAVAFAADKLASRRETQPVARILVVISDGQDNSSSTTLKQAIDRAQHGEVAVFTVSSREVANHPEAASWIGEHALTTLADLTGGGAFTPGSVGRLKGSLTDLQQVIRSRYLVSYKPASFKRDGQYRAINISVNQGGHKLHVYARKGYFASASLPNPDRN